MMARLLALAMVALLGGCVAGEPVNPNAAAPKLIVQPRTDGNVTLYVHGAFSERMYDWVALAVDNETLVNRSEVFSVEETVPTTGFFVDVSAGLSAQVYVARARVDVAPSDGRVFVATLDQTGRWSDARAYGLPFGTILERRDSP